MLLDEYLRCEGRVAHDSILYRRLALLPGLCNGSEKPSGAVLRGVPVQHVQHEAFEEPTEFRLRACVPPKKPAAKSPRASPTASMKLVVKGARSSPKSADISIRRLRHKRLSLISTDQPEGERRSGVEELHTAISNTIAKIFDETQMEFTECFNSLSSHIKAYTHGVDSECLREILFMLKDNRASDVPTSSRLALFFLDHAFYLLENLHPALRDTLLWCRSCLAAALYCPRTNIHPSDVGALEGEMAESARVYLGAPTPPSEDSMQTVLREGKDANLGVLLRRYSGRLTCEDNAALQVNIEMNHEMIKSERAHARRVLQAEHSVAEYWKRSIRALLFMAWRFVIARERSERIADEDKVLLERELALAKRATAEQIKEKARVEGLLFDQVMNMDQKVKQTSQSLREAEDKLREEKDNTLQLHKKLLQLKAEQILLRDRVRRTITKQEKAVKSESEMKARLEEAEQTAASLQQMAEEHTALVAAVRTHIGDMHFKFDPSTAIPPGTGMLPKWYNRLYSKWTGLDTLDRLAKGIHKEFPVELPVVDYERVSKETDDVDKASHFVAILRRIVGEGCPITASALVPPIQHDVVLQLVTLFMAKACQPTHNELPEGIPVSDLCSLLGTLPTKVKHLADSFMHTVQDLVRWPASHVAGLLHAPQIDADSWAFSETHVMTSNPLKGLWKGTTAFAPLTERVKNYALELTEIRETYGTVFFIASNMQDVVTDAGVPPEVELDMMTCLPAKAREKVSNAALAVSVVSGAVSSHRGMRPEAAFEMFMRDVILPKCRGTAGRGRVADVFVLYRESTTRAFQRMGSPLAISAVAQYLENHGLLLTMDETDTWAVLTSRSLEDMLALLYTLDTGRALESDVGVSFPHFQTLLLVAAEMKYPSPLVLPHHKLERVFRDILQYHPGDG